MATTTPVNNEDFTEYELQSIIQGLKEAIMIKKDNVVKNGW